MLRYDACAAAADERRRRGQGRDKRCTQQPCVSRHSRYSGVSTECVLWERFEQSKVYATLRNQLFSAASLASSSGTSLA
eukprot:CAMPEP_0185834030 /NCGR_PEP_ID=MMETSP1353-20130828/3951_1 /TAXON_ID=1077150 /ORGANISM="Erythrolobus australicus, Strain CCMP3124" /LENGTH=78 /DNA_ID=CAMNT_0028532377 /DNA_START=189 /DNA_END=425 /DNA_ORIENTATION=-